jgi:DNA adenine methylase
MAYVGGKSKSSQHILEILNNPIFDGMDYIEPFCGYCHILRRIENKKSYTISDNNEYLITLLKHVQKSKEHPTISKTEYDKLRENPSSNKLHAAYAGFTYSYNGKWFGGYTVTHGDRNYPRERKHYYDTLHDNPSFKDAKISWKDYDSVLKGVRGKLIYCDPPYEDTTEYHSSFDSPKFWEAVRKASKNNIVFVSEYQAPEDFVCVSQLTKRNSLAGRGATRKRVEKLFIHKPCLSSAKLKPLLHNPYRCKTRKSTKRTTRRAAQKN